MLQTQKLDGSTDVQLILARALDRESRDLYKMKVVAYDGGSSPRSGEVEVRVVVTDANDNGPVFESRSYEVDVDENVAMGTTVAKVTASDADAGINAEVSGDELILTNVLRSPQLKRHPVDRIPPPRLKSPLSLLLHKRRINHTQC